VRRATMIIGAIAIVSGCGGPGSSPSHNDSRKTTCEKANAIQRQAAKVEAAIAGGSSDTNAIDTLGAAVTGAVNGAKKGTPEGIDLNVVLADVHRLRDDAGDRSKILVDANTLRNSLIKLGMDCSRVLTG
jgi:hypothetical protein